MYHTEMLELEVNTTYFVSIFVKIKFNGRILILKNLELKKFNDINRITLG